MLITTTPGREYPLWRYALLFSELEGKLNELREKHPSYVRIEKSGLSHEGRDLFTVIIANDVTDESIRSYEAFRERSLRQPDEIITDIRSGKCYAIPLYFNCNLHGHEISGTDGLLSFIEEIVGTEMSRLLDDAFIIISICANPDGRARGIDLFNAHGIDLNRDMAAQTQPETRAIIEHALARFFPVTMVDMHGYMGAGNIMIDACTPPHNPNIEYDLLEPHMHRNAQKMADVIQERLRLKTDIPALLWKDGWEDYSPIYTSTYSQSFGCIAHTLETNFPNEEGAAVTHCGALGSLLYAIEHKNELLINQCEYFRRGITGSTKAKPGPAFYVIPYDQETQRDLSVTKNMLEILLRNRIRVYRSIPSGDYVIPTAQPLRGLIHNLLWKGEDVTEQAENMYDVSFYSHPVMRGITAIELNQLADGTGLSEVSEIAAIAGVFTSDDSLSHYSFSSGTNDSIKLVHFLLRRNITVYRASHSTEHAEAGDFFFKKTADEAWLEDFLSGQDIRMRAAAALPSEAHVVRSPKVLIVSDSGGVYEVLKDWGFNADFLPFSELNGGYEIKPEEYDVFLLGGTRLHLWSDPFDDSQIGVGYGNTWALRQRGRDEVLRAAGLFDNLIMYGYSGMIVNETLGFIPGASSLLKGSEHKNEHEDWHLNTSSGSFNMTFDPTDPIGYGFNPKETFYLVGPHGLVASAEAKAPVSFAAPSFINGWCKNEDAYCGNPAVLYTQQNGRTNVLMGIDPCFRKYTDASFHIMANTLLLTAYA
ncbi:Zinc carboxypeptidase [Paenibacillaceae bacterium GAS479]|nr:Zinc carboxypeptidase [Paenibacillaceae bacterium GAS479]